MRTCTNYIILNYSGRAAISVPRVADIGDLNFIRSKKSRSLHLESGQASPIFLISVVQVPRTSR